MKNLKISSRLFLLVIIPVAILLLLIIIDINGINNRRQEAKTLVTTLEVTTALTALVHELQKERGFSAAHMGSDDEAFRQKLQRQQEEADQAHSVFTQRLDQLVESDSSRGTVFDPVRDRLKQRDKIRREVLGRSISGEEAIGWFSQTIGLSLNTVRDLSEEISQGALVRDLSAYLFFLQCKERAGQERARLANVFARSHFDPKAYEALIRLISVQQEYEDLFLNSATPDHRQQWEKLRQDAIVERATGYRNRALRYDLGVDPGEWIKTQTGKIEIMKKMEDTIVEDLLAEGNRILDKESGALSGNLLFSVFTLVIVLGAAWLFSRGIVVPVRKTVAFFEQLRDERELTSRLSTDSGGEFETLAQSINAFLEKVEEVWQQVHVANTDLGESSTHLVTMSEKMLREAEALGERANTVAASTEEMSQGMSVLSDTTTRSGENFQAISTGTEQMTATIREISVSASRAREISQEAVENVDRANGHIDQLDEANREVESIIDVITGIADQTRLLALNATIEAARAGDAGKGFGVVAREVKELAWQTSTATESIREKVSAMQESSTTTIKEIRQISRIIGDMNEIVSGIAVAVEEQTATTQDISSHISQANSSILEITGTMTQVSEATRTIAQDIHTVSQQNQEYRGESHELRQSAEHLSAMGKKLASVIGEFHLGQVS